MSFSDKSSNKFFTILAGKFTVRVPEGTPGATTRVNKIGKTVHEVQHDSFTGILRDIRVTESAEGYGKTWNFDLQSPEGETMYTLQLSYSNSFSTALLKILPNLDLTQPFTMTPSTKEVDGKKQSTMFVNQNDTPVKHAYTKENPNGLPQMEELTVKGVKTWDDTKRLAFLENMVNTELLPKMHKATPQTPTNIETIEDFKKAMGEPEGNFEISEEDVPF